MNEKCYVSDMVTFKRCHTRESTQKLHVTEQVMQKMSLHKDPKPCWQGRDMRRDVRGLHSTAAHHGWTQLGARAGLASLLPPRSSRGLFPTHYCAVRGPVLLSAMQCLKCWI